LIALGLQVRLMPLERLSDDPLMTL
jgi:hypothetical protein